MQTKKIENPKTRTVDWNMEILVFYMDGYGMVNTLRTM